VFTASFLASSVEFVEAFTIVLVIGVTVNWKSSLWGALAGIVILVGLIAVLGTTLVSVIPIGVLRLVVGILLLLFGLKWIKKAILRYAGIMALHDEELIYERKLAEWKARGDAAAERFNGFGFVTSFKSVLLEGLEVAFIVITFGAQAASNSGIAIASLGALAALVLVILLGALVRSPLQKVPENTLKFIVGIMLTTFGTFWGGEGLGIEWWGTDLFLVVIAVFYLVLSLALVGIFRKKKGETR